MAGGTAAIVTAGVVALIAGFIALGLLFGLTPLYAGFLLLWYWGSVDMIDGKALAPLLVGACAGTATHGCCNMARFMVAWPVLPRCWC